LKTTFTNDDFRLRQPLGKWREIPQRHYLQLYDHKRKILMVKAQDRWKTHQLLRTRRRTLEFQTQGREYEQNTIQDVVPIDIIRTSSSVIITTIPAETELQTKPSKTYNNSTTEYISNHYSRFQHLHNSFEWAVDNNTTMEHFTSQQLTHIATDGGYDPSTGISTYGWVIASNDTILATGRGPAEAHPTMANSFRAEGYGAASALLFVIAYMESNQIPLEHTTWKLHIDNKSMVGRLSEHNKSWARRPKHQTRPESDITNIAEKLLCKLPKVQVLHVKSHQDNEKQIEELSWPARLNIAADRLATEQRETMSAPAHIVTNTTHGMLHIEKIAITRNAGQILWKTASRIPIQDYHIQRNAWSPSIFQSINWEAQHSALLQFCTADQQRILKFVHKWLPTGKNLHREKEANILACPLCSNELEDNMHLFTCTDAKQERLQQDLLLYVAKQQHDKEMPDIAKLLEWALSNCVNDDKWLVDKTHYPEELHRAIEDQNAIGWNQIYRGRISIEFSNAQEHFYRWQQLPETTHNGHKWTRGLIHKIWETMLSLWHNRNTIKFDKDTQRQTQNMQKQLQALAQHCYSQAHILSATDRKQLFQKTLEDRLKDNPRTLQAWITNTERILRINKLEDPHILKSRKKMEEYFQWKKKRYEP
jgi:ribonuclease HI